MKFLLDENVPNRMKQELVDNKIDDIKRINDFGKGLPDERVFDISLNERRILITIDKDFYAYKEEINCGIISLSSKLNDPARKIIEVIEQIRQDQRFTFDNDYNNVFIRITNENFKVIYRKRNRYKKVTCNYKKEKHNKKKP